MNIFLWVLQGLLAAVFLMTGILKLLRTKEQLGKQMGWVEDFSAPIIRLIGAAELLGAAGLTLPALTGILPWLTPCAAAGLALDMAGAFFTHLRRKEYAFASLTGVLLALAAVTAVGRLWVAPL